MDHNTHTRTGPGSGWSRNKIALVTFLAIAGFYLLAEYRAHTFAVLPFLLLPACLLMHVFIHGRHGGHARHGAASSEPPAPIGQPTPPPAT